MIRYFLITLFGIVLISITGCYTRLVIQNDYNEEERPIVIPDPEPDPCLCGPYPPPPIPYPPPIIDPPEEPIKERPYKTRNPQTDRPTDNGDRERIRNTGGRTNAEEKGKGRR